MIVKVCGVRTAEVAQAAIDAGADWLGLVLVPASVRHADDAAARSVVAAVADRADVVGVMVDATPAGCEEAAQRYRLSAVQLHGDVPASLALSAPVPVIRAINVHSAPAAFTDQWWPGCTILLDAAPLSDADLPGGTGEQVDQVTAAAMARHRRLILAGGLTASNVADAIVAVRPHGVDASSGLESAPGVKDPARVEAFVRAARAAAAAA